MLQTRRLLIREMDSADLPFLVGLLSDPDVMGFWQSPLTREESGNWLLRQCDRYKTRGFGYWLVTKTDGEPIGQAGLLPIEVDQRAEIGLGYMIGKLHWNRGYATEAAAACLKYAFSDLQVSRVVAPIRPGNTPSERVATKLGMWPERMINAWGYPHCVYVVTKERFDLSGVRKGYDRWAQVYDHDANPLPALEEPLMKEAMGDVRGLTVLDLGCGTGRHAVWMAAAGADVTAVDFSEGMLAEARRKPESGGVRFITHDLHEPLPFLNDAFDLVISGLVLEHLRDLRSFFSEARRVSRPGGRAIFSAMHPAMFLRGSQARFTDPASGEVVQPGSLPHRFGDLIMAALEAGFRVEDISEYAPDAMFASRYPRAQKYVGWPMLVMIEMHKK